MIKMLLSFLVVFGIVFVGIETFKSLSKKERWSLTKTVIYSTIIAVVTVVLLTLIVILF